MLYDGGAVAAVGILR